MKMSLRYSISTACAVVGTLALTGPGAAHSTPIDVPAPYRHAVVTGPLQCANTEVTADLIAAQLWAESRWIADAVSPAGALGPAQLLPQTFAVYGADDDGNGVASPFDIADAVGALVRLDCMTVTNLKAADHPTDPVSIAAAYRGGLALVDDPDVRKDAASIFTDSAPSR